jgi:hypothetical protein
MSTNVYDYDERWHFGERPAVYYGWAITTSSDNLAVAHFEKKKQCRELEKKVKALLPDFLDHVLVAACLAIQEWGRDSDRDFAKILLEQEFEEGKIELTDELEEKLDGLVGEPG